MTFSIALHFINHKTMSGKIYLIQENDTLQPMSEQPYANEDLLQTLLEKYPDLLAGDQINEAAPRRWLLVSREVGVPDEAESFDRWSLDHLFLDQEAIPTLVEVKRSSDTRIRREVVGQMLDYAANAVVYWSLESIRAKFEVGCDNRGQDPAQLVAALIETDIANEVAIETFWRQVKINLGAGRIRLVFVADEIPTELRRIIEFLNIQMDPAEVLAIELKQYIGQGLKTLVPKVIGQTMKNRPIIETQWDEPSFFQALTAKRGADEATVARKLFDKWIRPRAKRIKWGKGSKIGSLTPILNHQNGDYDFLVMWTSGSVEIRFYALQRKSPFDSQGKRQELLNKLNSIAGISFQPTIKVPQIFLSVLKDETALDQFCKILDWVVEQINSL